MADKINILRVLGDMSEQEVSTMALVAKAYKSGVEAGKRAMQTAEKSQAPKEATT